MSKRDIGQEILDGIQAIKAYKAGQANLRTRTLTAPAPPQTIRAQLCLSQAAFARPDEGQRAHGAGLGTGPSRAQRAG